MNHSYGRMIADSLAARLPHVGKVYFVSGSGLVNWEELSEMFPTGPEGTTRVQTTLQAAIDASESLGHDVIFVAPEHTETITAAAGITLNKSGLTIIGLGDGDRRPTISYSTATGADFEIDNPGCRIENIVFDFTGIDALTGPIDVDAADTIFKNCKFITADSGGQCVVGIVTDANADRMDVDGCEFIGSQDAGTVSAIRIVGGDDSKIRNSHFIGNYKITAGGIQVTTTIAGNLLVKNNTILNTTQLSTAALDFKVGTTARVVGNIFGVKSGTTPIHLNELTGAWGKGGGYILSANNYYRAATAPAAGTLL